MKQMKDIDRLSNEDLKLARRVERAGLATISTVARTIVRANEGDKTALATVKEWEQALNN